MVYGILAVCQQKAQRSSEWCYTASRNGDHGDVASVEDTKGNGGVYTDVDCSSRGCPQGMFNHCPRTGLRTTKPGHEEYHTWSPRRVWML